MSDRYSQIMLVTGDECSVALTGVRSGPEMTVLIEEGTLCHIEADRFEEFAEEIQKALDHFHLVGIDEDLSAFNPIRAGFKWEKESGTFSRADDEQVFEPLNDEGAMRFQGIDGDGDPITVVLPSGLKHAQVIEFLRLNGCNVGEGN